MYTLPSFTVIDSMASMHRRNGTFFLTPDDLQINPYRKEILRQCIADKTYTSYLLCQARYQLSVHLLKTWPLLGIPPPAAQHQISVDCVRTAWWLWQIHLGTGEYCSSIVVVLIL